MSLEGALASDSLAHGLAIRLLLGPRTAGGKYGV